jgi:hypothetical protein
VLGAMAFACCSLAQFASASIHGRLFAFSSYH